MKTYPTESIFLHLCRQRAALVGFSVVFQRFDQPPGAQCADQAGSMAARPENHHNCVLPRLVRNLHQRAVAAQLRRQCIRGSCIHAVQDRPHGSPRIECWCQGRQAAKQWMPELYRASRSLQQATAGFCAPEPRFWIYPQSRLR